MAANFNKRYPDITFIALIDSKLENHPKKDLLDPNLFTVLRREQFVKNIDLLDTNLVDFSLFSKGLLVTTRHK